MPRQCWNPKPFRNNLKKIREESQMKITLNPNAEVVKAVKEGLELSGGYCPCRRTKSPETKCMCREFRDQIKDPNFEGFCHCMLYYKSK